MATGAQAIARIAEATGILPATVSRAARILREADPSLWPEAGKGGGKRAAHVELSHLVNIVLALAIADPITSAPEAVLAYRSLKPGLSREYAWTENQTDLQYSYRQISGNEWPITQGEFATWLFGETLGEGLEDLVACLTPKIVATSTTALDTLQAAKLSVVLSTGKIPQAIVRGYPISDQDERTDLYLPETLSTAQVNLEPLSSPEGMFGRDITIPFNLFKVLGELWADTLVHRPNTKLPSSFLALAAPDVEQENENAGPSPEDPASVRDQAALPRDPGGVTRLEHREVREKSQPPSGAARSLHQSFGE